MNTDAPWPDLYEAESRVLRIQTKLHQWAIASFGRRFDDLFNLVADPAFLTAVWARVRGNRGARTAGVDGVKPRSVVSGTATFLPFLRKDLKERQFRPLPVREKLIPKRGGKLRGLGSPTARDRTVQAALKLVPDPIFSRGTSNRVVTVSAPDTGRRTQLPRFITSHPALMSGSWRATSRHASTKSRTLVLWTGSRGGSETSWFCDW